MPHALLDSSILLEGGLLTGLQCIWHVAASLLCDIPERDSSQITDSETCCVADPSLLQCLLKFIYLSAELVRVIDVVEYILCLPLRCCVELHITVQEQDVFLVTELFYLVLQFLDVIVDSLG